MEDINNIYTKVLTTSLQIPGAKVNRNAFLETNLNKYCTKEEIYKAVNFSVKDARISPKILNKIAKNVINNHTFKATSISTAAGMPGGFAMAATIPADLAQFYFHIIVLAQKLAYLYGYPDFEGDGEADEELVHHLTLFIGVMYGVNGANKAVLEISRRLASETVKRLPRQALTKTAYYPIIKNVAKWVGIKLTKKGFAQGLGKLIPIVGGLISGGVTYASFSPMAKKLKKSLEEGYNSSANGFNSGEVLSA